MELFSFFKKTAVVHSFEALGVDMHSHLLPGIDDGAKTMEDTIAYIRQLHALGYHKLITTPHINSEYYPNTPEIILSTLETVRQRLQQEAIPVELSAAAEYYMDDTFGALLDSNTPLLCIRDRQVLVEMSFFGAPPRLEEYLFRLASKGYKPILAHPERYGFMHRNYGAYERLKELGCLFQVNLLSLIGYYDKPVQEAAEQLVRRNMVDFLGTDLHHQRHLDQLKNALEYKRFREAIVRVTAFNPI